MRCACVPTLVVTALTGMAWGQTAATPLIFSDDFESYATGEFPCSGAGCVGAGGWGLWFYMYNPGPQPAEIVRVQHNQAVRMGDRSDILRFGHIGSGRWTVRARTYWPSNLTGPSDNGYFILLNECNLTPPILFASLVLFEGPSGLVKVIGHEGARPLAMGEWSELRMEVDLDENLLDIYYNEQALALGIPYAPQGEPALQGVALYSDGVVGQLFDDVSVAPAGEPNLCYANCDRSTTAPALNVQDFTCFLQRYARGNLYANCDGSTTVPIINVGDFTCFLTEYAAGCAR